MRNYLRMKTPQFLIKLICLPSINIINNKNELCIDWQTVRQSSFQKPAIIAIRFTIRASFCVIPSFNFLNGYFHVLLNLVTVPGVRIVINFVTQFLWITFVLVAPRWSLSPPQQKTSIAIGGNGSLDCQVTAFPTAKITWFKNGKQVQFAK